MQKSKTNLIVSNSTRGKVLTIISVTVVAFYVIPALMKALKREYNEKSSSKIEWGNEDFGQIF